MIELELIAYDKHDGAVYRIKSRNTKDICASSFLYATGEYVFRFPLIDSEERLKQKGYTAYILDGHHIPTFGEPLKKFFGETAKQEIEKEINDLLKDKNEQRLLLEMLFRGLLILNDKN